MNYLNTEHLARWFLYRDNRNNTAHDYGEAFAKQTLVLMPNFLTDLGSLTEKLTTRLGKSTDA